MRSSLISGKRSTLLFNNHMKNLVCMMLGFFGIVGGVESSFAQNRTVGARMIILDDGAGNTVTLQTAAGATGTFTFPNGGGTIATQGFLSSNYLPLAGGTMTGAINMGTHNLTAVGALNNTTDNIIGPDESGGGAGSIEWEGTTNGYMASFYNKASSGGPFVDANGLLVKVTSATANTYALMVSQGTSVGAFGTELFGVTGDGNVVVPNGQFTATSGVVGAAGTFNNSTASATAALVANTSSSLPGGSFTGVGTISTGSRFGVIGTSSGTGVTTGAGVYGATSTSGGGVLTSPPPGMEGVTTNSIATGIMAVSANAGSGPALQAISVFGSTADAADFTGNVNTTGNVGVTGQLTTTSSVVGAAGTFNNPTASATTALVANNGSTASGINGTGTSSAGYRYGVIGVTSATGTTTGAGLSGANTLAGAGISTEPAPGVQAVTSTGGIGLLATSTGAGSGPALAAQSLFGSTADAGDFFGNVTITGNLNVTGTVSKGGGSFKIDDPIDPANKYLYHSFVESPDMMNIYNGVISLDANGEAMVTMPKWFEALNGDFRYQLTSIGAPGPNLYIAQEVTNNTFKIAGGKAGAKVSWQVTGIRHDAFANAHRIPTEVDKAVEDRGAYLHPEAIGRPAEEGIGMHNLAKTAVTTVTAPQALNTPQLSVPRVAAPSNSNTQVVGGSTISKLPESGK
jgi:hypothetical protein